MDKVSLTIQECNAKLKWNLTEREIDILCCALAGMSWKETAEKLSVSVATVNFHCGNITRKTKTKNRIQIAGTLLRFNVDLVKPLAIQGKGRSVVLRQLRASVKTKKSNLKIL